MKNKSKFISNIFLGFSILLILYTFYRSEFYHSGTKFNYYLKYYIISLTLIVSSVASFFVSKELKVNIGIVLISTIIGLYLVDGYLFTKTLQFNIWRKGKDFDTRKRHEVYLELKKENKDISITTHPAILIRINRNNINDSNHILLPLSGISNKKTIFCNENGYYSIYQSDRHGFNNPDTEWDKSQIEYLLIGDSFVHGACINEPNTMDGNIRRMIKEKEEKTGVLALGYGGNGPLLEYATLREYLPIVKASVGTTTLLYYYGVQEYFEYFFDDDIKKHNLYAPGTNIKVLSSNQLLKLMPDYVVIFAWRYSEIIIKKNGKYIDKGGKFITPLPNFKII